jgi:hypothetical protein
MIAGDILEYTPKITDGGVEVAGHVTNIRPTQLVMPVVTVIQL